MHKLKAGQKVILEDGSRAIIEEGDCLEESNYYNQISKEMKKFGEASDNLYTSLLEMKDAMIPIRQFLRKERHNEAMSILDKIEKLLTDPFSLGGPILDLEKELRLGR